jgi:hypothetical protein
MRYDDPIIRKAHLKLMSVDSRVWAQALEEIARGSPTKRFDYYTVVEDGTHTTIVFSPDYFPGAEKLDARPLSPWKVAIRLGGKFMGIARYEKLEGHPHPPEFKKKGWEIRESIVEGQVFAIAEAWFDRREVPREEESTPSR